MSLKPLNPKSGLATARGLRCFGGWVGGWVGGLGWLVKGVVFWIEFIGTSSRHSWVVACCCRLGSKGL